jgi:cystathionine beta-lyase/cystathionine gamma-synthase
MEQAEERSLDLATVCARAREASPGGPPPLTTPICQTAVWRLESLEQVEAVYRGEVEGYIYTRDANPNHAALERLIAQLEGAPAALVTATGMGAIAAGLVSLLAAGDHVVASDRLYGATTRFVAEELARFGVTATFVPVHDLAAVRAALRERTRLVLAETLANPLVGLADVPALAEICRERGAALFIDHTFAPCLARPLALGADVVMHSLTKFIGGHSDLTLGALAGSEAFITAARARTSVWGLAANPFEAWLALRGAATLPLRMERASQNAARIAAFLAAHRRVRAVHYPGLPSHPQYARCRELLASGGAMLAFEVDDEPAAARLIRALRLVAFAPSLGDAATTLSYPARTSHRALMPAQQAALGITPGLLRLSVGIDAAADIIADLDQALGR